MAQRISRAKQRVKETGAELRVPKGSEYADRLGAVLHTLYLIFNEGYTATSGSELLRGDLTSEAIRLARVVCARLPEDGEVVGLLALMLLTDARSAARTSPEGDLIPLAEQDRSQWDREAIIEGVELVSGALSTAPLGPYQLQAAIAAIHAEAADADDTDWPQIVALYRLLERIAPSPMVTLNHAVAVGMASGPKAGLALLDTLADDRQLADHHRLHGVRAHFLEMAGDHTAARSSFLRAAQRTTSLPERRYLEHRAARLG